MYECNDTVCTLLVDPKDHIYAYTFEGTKNGADILDSSIVLRQEGWMATR